MTRRAHNFDDKIGKIYGDLVVLKFNGFKIESRGKKKSLWLCKCICGKEIVVVAGNLSSGNTTNCGCNRITRLQSYVDNILRLPKGEASFNALYSKYRYGAEDRHLEFELSKEVFKEICNKNCYYCGSKPSTIEPAFKYRNGEFVYNGIDRVDNNKGYTVKNSVPCCKKCNFMKLDLTKKEFLDHIQKIVVNMKGKKINV